MNWRKLRNSQMSCAETFLRSREAYCVGAISRFSAETAKRIWVMYNKTHPETPEQNSRPEQASVSALLLYARQILFPVFSSRNDLPQNLPLPPFFSFVLSGSPLHAVQGLEEDVDRLESTLKKRGLIPSTMFRYELRSLEADPAALPAVQGPPGLVTRKPSPEDIDNLFPLQLAYEEEEVLPPGAVLDPAVCRKTLQYLAAGNKMILAELDGLLVGKIHINAQSFTRFQIGGVYVLPAFRNLGIARAMTAALVRELVPRKRNFTLFVKKTNIPARRVYDSLGFTVTGDYRIDYFL